MCGRYAYVPTPEAWARFLEVLGPEVGDALKAVKARYNIASTDKVPIVLHDRRAGGSRVVEDGRGPRHAPTELGRLINEFRSGRRPRDVGGEGPAIRPRYRRYVATARSFFHRERYATGLLPGDEVEM